MFLPYSSLSEGSVRSGLKLALPLLFHSVFHHFVDDDDDHHRFLRPPNLQKVPFLPQMAHLRFVPNCHRLVQLSWTNCNHTRWGLLWNSNHGSNTWVCFSFEGSPHYTCPDCDEDFLERLVINWE